MYLAGMEWHSNLRVVASDVPGGVTYTLQTRLNNKRMDVAEIKLTQLSQHGSFLYSKWRDSLRIVFDEAAFCCLVAFTGHNYIVLGGEGSRLTIIG
jgi:hypothetical protein